MALFSQSECKHTYSGCSTTLSGRAGVVLFTSPLVEINVADSGKAPSSTVRASGSTTSRKELQPSKAPASMRITELGMVNVSSERHSLNAKPPIEVTESGMVNALKELHRLKAKSSKQVTELLRCNSAKELHPVNASNPMQVTELGIVSVLSELQSWKA